MPLCYKCGGMDHTPELCRVRWCYTCGSNGHWREMCPTLQPSSDRPCFNCDGIDHWGQQCNLPQNISRYNPKLCDYSGHYDKPCPGHIRSNCRAAIRDGIDPIPGVWYAVRPSDSGFQSNGGSSQLNNTTKNENHGYFMDFRAGGIFFGNYLADRYAPSKELYNGPLIDIGLNEYGGRKGGIYNGFRYEGNGRFATKDFPLSDDGNHSDGGYNTNEVITPPNEGSLDESALSLFNKIDSKKEEEFLIFDTDMEEFKSEDSRDGDGIGVCCARCEEDKPNKDDSEEEKRRKYNEKFRIPYGCVY